MEALIKKTKGFKKVLEQANSNFKKTGEVRRTIGYLRGRIETIEKAWDEFLNNHQKILSEAQEELVKSYEKTNVFEECEAAYFEYLGDLQDEIHNRSVSDPPSNKKEAKVDFKAEIKLPSIELPKFNGDYTKWRSFHDMFESLIHKDPHIPMVQKLQYLKSNLTGEPERILRQYDVTSSNYQAAWTELTQRYNNKRVLVFTQLKTLFNQVPIKYEHETSLKGLYDKTKECLHELSSLGVSTKDWDPLIIFIIVEKLPNESRTLWEQSISKNTEIPELKEMFSFIETRFRTLEAMGPTKPYHANRNKHGQSKILNYHVNESHGCVICKERHHLQYCDKFREHNITTRRKILSKYNICFNCLQRHNGSCMTNSKCSMCKGNHILQKCTRFKQQGLNARREFVAKNKLCTNCLKAHHKEACPNQNGCFKCDKRHHTWLHDDQIKSSNKPKAAETTQQPQPNSSVSSTSANACSNQRNSPQALLATAVVYVKDRSGLNIPLRALIDLGSQSSFITEAAYQTLQLKGFPTSLQITGLGSTQVARASKEVSLHVKSITAPDFELPLKAYVIKKITNIFPPTNIRSLDWTYLKDLSLADPEFLKSGKIDLLLGVNIYGKILCKGIKSGPQGTPIAQNTKLGWILFGETLPKHENGKNQNFSAFATNSEDNIAQLNEQVRKFWEWEELPPKRRLTKEEEQCEQFFSENHKRLDDGSYQVRLPFKEAKDPILGDSKQMAIKRFTQLEKKFDRDAKLHEEYKKCIQEYIELGHMHSANQNAESTNATQRYYLPHHAVVKDSTTTKLRVVFDASAKTSNGRSLNEQMLTGPTLQPKLYSTLLKWRIHKYAVTADIQKMYRMIKIHEDDRKYHTMLWRESKQDVLKEYELNTVTFGTTAAPYLAIKTLQQLATDDKAKFPRGSEIALQDFYVDDLLTGGNTIVEVKQLQQELIKLLKGGSFNLRKWAANHEELLDWLPGSERELELPLKFEDDNQVKALGIQWHPATDQFTFAFKPSEFETEATTKRKILSQVAKLFDPLGWIGPCVILAKILIQKLWIWGCSWDERVPEEYSQEWKQFKSQLSHILEVKIPRWVQTCDLKGKYQLHGFCDASVSAYAAVVYIRVTDNDGCIHTRLLMAKTRVAPAKPVTLPRLELCGAVLLTRLLSQIRTDMQLKDVSSYSWTDSKIVLAWITGHPNKWRTYVANRVAEIQEGSTHNTWSYVPTKDNPADAASRGVMPINIIDCDSWWAGPTWLREPVEKWPNCKTMPKETSLEAKSIKTLTTQDSEAQFDLVRRFSSLQKLLHITAQCLRFVHNCRHKDRKIVGKLTPDEIEETKSRLIKHVQMAEFAHELKQLREERKIEKQSRLINLCPFLDANSIMRVSGRLHNTELPFATKHPAILPKDHFFTKLVIDHYHKQTLHGGPQLVLNTIRNQFWIINGLHAVKKRIHNCLTCFRHRPRTQQQLMGSLPTPRVAQAHPFENTGLDYAGPMDIKVSKYRGSKIYKGYLCIFVCMATKAIHIEVVSDLTSETFLAAFRRFIARRGLCANVYSDNGTTFVGANKVLQQELRKAIGESAELTASKVADMGIKWHFIPPSAPHHGGLWEAGVKSVKHHLKRTLASTILTYEELHTLVIQIEACLNSRPLCSISISPDEPEVMTPGHFLVGRPLLAAPEPTQEEPRIHLLKRWQLIQQLRQQFWKRWSLEYLTDLQKRQKWNVPQPNVEVGQVVIIKDEKQPPTKWLLGIIKFLHPGHDGKVRVVTVKTSSNTLQRPIQKICPLPIDNM